MTNTTHYLTQEELDKLLFWYAFKASPECHLGEWICKKFGWGDPRLFWCWDNSQAERILRTEYVKD